LGSEGWAGDEFAGSVELAELGQVELVEGGGLGKIAREKVVKAAHF
jgi:hypothetical protein